jgi:hypothetical protein
LNTDACHSPVESGLKSCQKFNPDPVKAALNSCRKFSPGLVKAALNSCRKFSLDPVKGGSVAFSAKIISIFLFSWLTSMAYSQDFLTFIFFLA